MCFIDNHNFFILIIFQPEIRTIHSPHAFFKNTLCVLINKSYKTNHSSFCRPRRSSRIGLGVLGFQKFIFSKNCQVAYQIEGDGT